MKGETIHFKISHGGVARRFALPRDSDLIVVLKDRVQKIVGAEEVDVYWRDEESLIVLEDEEDIIAAVDYAETKNNLGCVSLEIGEMRVKANSKEEKKEEKKAVTMEESKASFNGFAFKCDGCPSYLASSNGGRYKCIICDNFDLCASCVAKNIHDNHALVLLRNAETEVPLLNETGVVLSMMAKDAHRCTPFFLVKSEDKKEEKEEKNTVKKEVKAEKKKVENRYKFPDTDDESDEYFKLLEEAKRLDLEEELCRKTEMTIKRDFDDFIKKEEEKDDKWSMSANGLGEVLDEATAEEMKEQRRREAAEIKEMLKLDAAIQKDFAVLMAKAKEEEKQVEQVEKKENEYSREEMMGLKKDLEATHPSSSSIPAELHSSAWPSFYMKMKESKKKDASSKNRTLISKPDFKRHGQKKENEEILGKYRRVARENDLGGEDRGNSTGIGRRRERYNGGADRVCEDCVSEKGRGQDRRRGDEGFGHRGERGDWDRGYGGHFPFTIRNDHHYLGDERADRRQEDDRRVRGDEGMRDVRYRGGRRDEGNRREDGRREGQRDRRDERDDERRYREDPREETYQERDEREWRQILRRGINFGQPDQELEELLRREDDVSRDRDAPSRREYRRGIREAMDREEERRRMEELEKLRREEEEEEANEDGYGRERNGRQMNEEERLFEEWNRREQEREEEGRSEERRDRRPMNERIADQENRRRMENRVTGRENRDEGRNGGRREEHGARNNERRDGRRDGRGNWNDDSDSDSDNLIRWGTPSEDTDQTAQREKEERQYMGMPTGYDSKHPDPRLVHPFHRKDAKAKRMEEKKQRAKEIEADYEKASQIPAHMAIAVIREDDMWRMTLSEIEFYLDMYIMYVQNNTYSLKPHLRIFKDGDDVELIGNIAIDLAKHLRSLRTLVRSIPRGDHERSDCLKQLNDRADHLHDALRQNGADGKEYVEIAERLRPILLSPHYTSSDGEPYGNWDDEFVGFMVADPLRDFAIPPRVASSDPSKEGLFAPVPRGCRGAKTTASVDNKLPGETNEKLLTELHETGLFDDYLRMYRVCSMASDLREAIDMMLKGDDVGSAFH